MGFKVQFASQGNVTENELRGGLVEAGIGLSMLLPVYLSLLLPRGSHVRASFIEVSALTTAATIVYAGVKFLVFPRGGTLSMGPTVVFTLVMSILLSATLVEVGAGTYAGIYTMTLALALLYLGIIGDLAMQVPGWVIAVALFAWSSWQTGHRGTNFWSEVLVNAWIFACVQTIAHHQVSDERKIARSRGAVDAITDAGSSCDSLEAALDACLPLVADAIPAGHVVALVRRERRDPFMPIAAWPHRNAEDASLTGRAEFWESVESNRVVLTADHCFVYVGHTPSGELILAIQWKGSRLSGLTYFQDAADALASGFLQVIGRIAHVSRLKEAGRTDVLTGLANRRELMDVIDREMVAATEGKRPVCFVMIDLDRFKQFNDLFGHLDGDELLRRVAHEMSGPIRPGDLLARYGGEEFCVVLPGTDLPEALAVVDGLRQAVHQDVGSFHVSISAGVACWDGRETVTEVLERADRALYQAKEQGRDLVVGSDAPAG